MATLAFDSARYVGARIGIFDPSGRKVGRVSHLSNQELVVIAGEPALVRRVVEAAGVGAAVGTAVGRRDHQAAAAARLHPSLQPTRSPRAGRSATTGDVSKHDHGGHDNGPHDGRRHSGFTTADPTRRRRHSGLVEAATTAPTCWRRIHGWRTATSR